MQTEFQKEVARLAAKLTTAFFRANPNTTHSQSEVQRRSRQVALKQLSEGSSEADNQSPAPTFEAALLALKALVSIEDLQAWANAFFAFFTFSHKKSGAKMVDFRKHPNTKFSATALEFDLDNGKKSTLNVETIRSYFNLVAK